MALSKSPGNTMKNLDKANIVQNVKKCRNHTDQCVVLQCRKCKIDVCVECVSSKHIGHPMGGIEDVYEHEKAALTNMVKEMEHSLPIFGQVITNASQKKVEYKKRVVTIKKEMERELNELKSEMDRIYKQRLEQLCVLEENDLNTLDGIESKFQEQKTKTEHTIAECKKLLASSNHVDLILYSKRSSKPPRIDDVDTSMPETPLFEAVDVKYFNAANTLGRLKLNMVYGVTMPNQVDTPMLVSSFRSGLKDLSSLCTTKNGNAWICGFNTRALSLMDNQGKVIGRRKVKYRPNCLAVMDNEDVVMSSNSDDSNAVWRLKGDGKEVMVYDASPSCCNGVSVTRDQEILICTGDGEVMMWNGSSTKQIYKGSGGVDNAIELPDKTICVSEFTNKQLLIIDRTGRVVRTITKPIGRANFNPSGLAVDVMNNILATDLNNHCVYLIKTNGDPIELVGKAHGVNQPFWLSIDTCHNLWIVQQDAGMKVVKYLK